VIDEIELGDCLLLRTTPGAEPSDTTGVLHRFVTPEPDTAPTPERTLAIVMFLQDPLVVVICSEESYNEPGCPSRCLHKHAITNSLISRVTNMRDVK
jgi:hypothetical protein